MKILNSWLNDFGAFGTDKEKLSAAMTNLGLAVESVETVGTPVKGVVVARVLRTQRHPDAAKVHRVYVDAGDGVELHVWCGAFNMKPGDLIPLATLGTNMPDDASSHLAEFSVLKAKGCSVQVLNLVLVQILMVF